MIFQRRQGINSIPLAGIALLLILPVSLTAAADTLSLTSGVDYSTGKYGGTAATDVTYIPVTGKYEFNDWQFKLTVPYLSVTAPGNVTPNIGQAVYTSNAVRTDSGLGDIVVATSYSLVNSARIGTVIDLTGKIKFGTADKFKGLGSGADDYASEISMYKIRGGASVFGTLGYKVYGQSTGYTLNNAFYGSLGVSNKFGDLTSVGVIYDYREQISSWGDPQKMWTIYLNRKINSNWKAQTYIFGGAGNSSPDIGGGAMLTEIF